MQFEPFSPLQQLYVPPVSPLELPSPMQTGPLTLSGRRISIASVQLDRDDGAFLLGEHPAPTDVHFEHFDCDHAQQPHQHTQQQHVHAQAQMPVQAQAQAQPHSSGALQCPFFNCGYRCQFGSDIVRHLFGNKHANAMRTMGQKMGYVCAECASQGVDSIFTTYMTMNTHRRTMHPPASYASAEASLVADRVQKRKNREFIDLVTSMVERANREDVMWLEDVVQGAVYTINRPIAPVAPFFR